VIPSLATNAATDTLPGSDHVQCGRAHANLEADRVVCLDKQRDDDAADGLTQLHTEGVLELLTARIKPKAFGTFPEKRPCARQLVLGTAITGTAF
jgi:hypothetical protein